MADKGHFRIIKDYSSEVLEWHVKTRRLTITLSRGTHTHQGLTSEEDNMANMSNDLWEMKCCHYNKRQQWAYSAFHNSVKLLIQMALSAQEPVTDCEHGLIGFLLGRAARYSKKCI